MNKMWTYSNRVKCFMLLCVFAAASTLSAEYTMTREENFPGPELPLFWTLDDAPESYNPDPEAVPTPGPLFSAGNLRFEGVGNYSYAHIQTTKKLDTSHGMRVDAIMRQDHWPTSTWGMGVTVYYDESNWISIKQGAAGGQEGWMMQGFVDGTSVYQMGNTSQTLRTQSLISGIELTETQIIFRATDLDLLGYGYSGMGAFIDYYEGIGDYKVVSELTLTRPAGFTGEATIIIGKGYTAPPTYPNPHFDNQGPADTHYAVAIIDYVRIQRNVYLPQYCGDEGTVYLPMDFDQNCYVNLLDFVEFAALWLHCNDPLDAYCD